MVYKSDYLVKLQVEKAYCSKQTGTTKELCANRERIVDSLLTANNPKSELERMIRKYESDKKMGQLDDEAKKNLAECKYLLGKLDAH